MAVQPFYITFALARKAGNDSNCVLICTELGERVASSRNLWPALSPNSVQFDSLNNGQISLSQKYSPSDVRGRREGGTGRPEVPAASAAVLVEVCDDCLPVEGGVRVPLVGSTLPLPAAA